MVCKPVQKLDALRREHGESLAALERATGISDSTLGRWFAGKGEPLYADMEVLAAHYHTTVEELCRDDSLPQQHTEQARQFFADTFRQLHSPGHPDDILAHHEAMLKAQAGLHKQLLDQQEHHYKVVVSYLKKQIRNLKLTAIIFLVLFILSLCFTVFITVADLPELGAGGTIAPGSATPLGFIRLFTIPLLVLLLTAVTVVLIGDRRKRAARSQAGQPLPDTPPEDPF